VGAPSYRVIPHGSTERKAIPAVITRATVHSPSGLRSGVHGIGRGSSRPTHALITCRVR